MADTSMIENHTFDEIEVGDTASVVRTLSRKAVSYTHLDVYKRQT